MVAFPHQQRTRPPDPPLYTHVLNRGGRGVRSPADALTQGLSPSGGIGVRVLFHNSVGEEGVWTILMDGLVP